MGLRGELLRQTAERIVLSGRRKAHLSHRPPYVATPVWKQKREDDPSGTGIITHAQAATRGISPGEWW